VREGRNRGRPSQAARLAELAGLFLRLGATAFGGPAAHVALLELEVVGRRGWLTRAEFLDYLGATNLIPGPNSTELAIHIGRSRAGTAGLVVAGAAFILPAAILVGAFAWAYVTFGRAPELRRLLYGVTPVVMAVVLQALWGLGRTAVRDVRLGVLAFAAVAAIAAGAHELVVLAAAGLISAGAYAVTRGHGAVAMLASAASAAAANTIPTGALALTVVAPTAAPFSLTGLFLVCVKIGSVLFGSGYVLLAFLRADLVERLGWLTEQQLLDATAVGLVTPGPVFTTATFVGYLLGGVPGAAAATAGIFLPAFVFVALSGPIVPRLRRSALAAAILDGVNVASLALMAVVSWQLARTALIDPLTWTIAGVSLALLVRYRVNSTWLILAGGLLGLITQNS
jgi:chromate transporter